MCNQVLRLKSVKVAAVILKLQTISNVSIRILREVLLYPEPQPSGQCGLWDKFVVGRPKLQDSDRFIVVPGCTLAPLAPTARVTAYPAHCAQDLPSCYPRHQPAYQVLKTICSNIRSSAPEDGHNDARNMLS